MDQRFPTLLPLVGTAIALLLALLLPTPALLQGIGFTLFGEGLHLVVEALNRPRAPDTPRNSDAP